MDTPQTPSTIYDNWHVSLGALIIHEDAHDAIPPIDSPQFISPFAIALDLNEEVFVYQLEDKVRICPVSTVWFHEIVNEQTETKAHTLSFCPITGSVVAWEGEIQHTKSTFGVSGHLYNNNLVAYDRATGNYWSQMTLKGIRGNLGGQTLKPTSVLRTSYKTAFEAYPNALVLFDTVRNEVCDSLCSPNVHHNPTIGEYTFPSNARLGVVVRDEALLFDYALFPDSLRLIETTFKGKPLLIVGSKTYGFVRAFSASHSKNFKALQNQLPNILEDAAGNRYDLLGNVTSGPDAGTRLDVPLFYSAKNFAWAPFFRLSYFE